MARATQPASRQPRRGGTVADQTALLLEMVKQLREDYARDQEAARQSRMALHSRVDEVIDRMGKMETTAALSGEIDAQVRTELDELRTIINGNAASIAPTIDEWKRIRALGLGLVGLLAIGGVSMGAILATAGDAAVNAVRGWLRIP